MIEDRAAKFGKFRFWCDEPHAVFFFFFFETELRVWAAHFYMGIAVILVVTL